MKNAWTKSTSSLVVTVTMTAVMALWVPAGWAQQCVLAWKVFSVRRNVESEVSETRVHVGVSQWVLPWLHVAYQFLHA